MPRRNRPSPKRSRQHARGLKRPQGAHKKLRSEGMGDGIEQLRRIHEATPDSEQAA